MNATITRIKAEIITKARAISKAMSNDTMACIEACAECAAACEYCMSQCLASSDVKSLTDCMKACAECANMCRACATCCAQGGGQMAEMCAMCAASCATCAAACATHVDMTHCVECADCCGDCVDQCTNMATMKSASVQTKIAPTTKQVAWSTLKIKETSDSGGKRTFTGTASTPSVDRMGDVVEPMGMQIKLPAPLLWQHNSNDPIGWITSAKATKSGIDVVCEIASIPDIGALKDRLDSAWQYLKSGLVRGLSIGFNPIESAQIDGTWGYRFLKWEMLELSAVTIPANQDCNINTIKSIDQQQRRAASGAHGGLPVVRLKTLPGVSGEPKARRPGAVYLN